MYGVMTGTVTRAVGAVCAVALVGVLPQAARAASEMELGGYHDEALRAAQQGLGLPGTDLQLQVTIEDSPRSALTAFTPRFGGIGNATRRTIEFRETGSDRLALTDSPDQVQLRLGDSTEIAGSAVGLAAVAEGQSEAAGEFGFRVGGQLAVNSLRLDAIYGKDSSALTVPGNRMTARVTYGLGPLDARISYDLVESEAAGESRQLELGSQLSLRPGVVVEGALAYGEDEQRDPTTAGLVSLRLNF
jgi:Gram-negative porin